MRLLSDTPTQLYILSPYKIERGIFGIGLIYTMPRGIPKKTLIEQFMAKVSKEGPVKREALGKCWSYIGSCDQNGYGKFRKERWGTHYAHIWSYRHHHGPTEGLVVRHKCDNPNCVNPDHLEIGTKNENAMDRLERNPMTCRRKITDEEAENILVLREAGYTYPELAEIADVHTATITNLCKGRVFYSDSVVVAPPRYMRYSEEVIKLRSEGCSLSEIARRLHIDWTTAKRVLEQTHTDAL